MFVQIFLRIYKRIYRTFISKNPLYDPFIYLTQKCNYFTNIFCVFPQRISFSTERNGADFHFQEDKEVRFSSCG